MTVYYSDSGELKEIPEALYEEWLLAGNQKAVYWKRRPWPPNYNPDTHVAKWVNNEWVIEAMPPSPVPEQVAAHYFRRSLREFGILGQVKQMLAQLPADHPVRDDFESAPHFRRNAVEIENFRVALGLTHAQVDDVFRRAEAIASETVRVPVPEMVIQPKSTWQKVVGFFTGS